MKYLKLFVFFFAIFFSICLYYMFFDEKNYYLSLGDDFAVGITPFNTKNNSYSDYFSCYLKSKKKLKYYNNYFSETNYRATDLTKDIKLNKVKIINNKKISINESIAKANIITISIGFNDVFYKAKYNKEEIKFDYKFQKYIDEITYDINELILTIRKINDTPIYFIGYYNPHIINDGITDEIIRYLEKKINELNLKNFIYVDIKEGFKNNSYYMPNKENYYPSLEGYNYISEKIIEKYKNK